jgi:hypothetical protein
MGPFPPRTAGAAIISRRRPLVSSDRRPAGAAPLAILCRMKGFLFVFRKWLAWFVALAFLVALIHGVTQHSLPDWVFVLAIFGTLAFVGVSSFSHVHRVRLVAGRVDREALANRHRRQIMLPFPADEAFELVDAAIRELPHVENVETARDSLQVSARVRYTNPYVGIRKRKKGADGGDDEDGSKRNLVRATVSPGERMCSLTLVCEPQGAAWMDWFLVDDATNLENAEAVSRAITRRVAERRKGEEAQVRATATEKELTVAKLSLLHAQVEPHFLYNTLASAQVLTRSDPARADQMLGNLIVYLRHSLPKTDESMSTVGEELERTRAYLEILKIRMGERLALRIQVRESLRGIPFPPMMLQTLAENAIKHGLEPVPGGGTIWIFAREADGKLGLTVADDGRGFSEDGGGTGIGLVNVRERLKLAYGEAASFSIVANFPRGVAATITVPLAGPPVEPAHA